MEWALAVLGIQGGLGAYDNFRNHEFQAGLPHRQSQWRELLLHSAREGLYCVLFPTMAWLEWRGWFAGVLAAIIVAELMVTCWDFVEEDRTRKLSANERVLHTLLTLNYGAFLALFVPVLLQWSSQPTALAVVYRGPWSWLMSIYSVGVLVFGLRELLAGLKHLRQRRGAACEHSVHQLALGPSFTALPAAIRAIYSTGPARVLQGHVDVRVAQGFIGQGLLGFMGLPRRAGPHGLLVRVCQDGGGELWERVFADSTFVSRFEAAGRPRRVYEYFGPLCLEYELIPATARLDWSLTDARLFGLSLPDALKPRVVAHEWEGEGGRYTMQAEVSLPGLGEVLNYGGQLMLGGGDASSRHPDDCGFSGDHP